MTKVLARPAPFPLGLPRIALMFIHAALALLALSPAEAASPPASTGLFPAEDPPEEPSVGDEDPAEDDEKNEDEEEKEDEDSDKDGDPVDLTSGAFSFTKPVLSFRSRGGSELGVVLSYLSSARGWPTDGATGH